MIHGDEFQTRRVTALLHNGELLSGSGFPPASEPTGTPGGSGMISGFGLGLSLRYGFVPSPFSAWDRVFVANCGETLQVKNGQVLAGFDLSTIRPGPQVDTAVTSADAAARFLAAVEEALRDLFRDRSVSRLVFLQSAGKDSCLIALALAQMLDSAPSVTLQPVTYEPGIRESEAPLVRAINERLGLPAPLIVEQDCGIEMQCAEEFVRKAPNVVGDLALVPYLRCLQRVGCGPSDIVVDGQAADLYMGMGVGPLQRLLLRAPQTPRALSRAGAAIPLFGPAWVVDRLDLAPAERTFPGTRLTRGELETVLTEELVRRMANLPREYQAQATDSRSVHALRSGLFRIQDGSSHIEKSRLAADLFGTRVCSPLASPPVTEVIRDLPAKLRFVGGLRPQNKPLARYILRSQPENQYTLRRKGSFRWNVRRFVETHLQQIRSEIRGSDKHLPGAAALDAALHRHRCPEIRARKLYLAWIVSRWTTETIERGAASAVRWEIPDVRILPAGPDGDVGPLPGGSNGSP